MSELFGIAVLAVIAYSIYSAYKAEQRELRLQERRMRRQEHKPKTSDAWRQAYILSESTRTFESWQAWMVERGYSPERIIEQAEMIPNRKG